MNILTENEINIKSLEKNFYDCGCKLAAEALANYLQTLDRELMKVRDKALLRHKGHRKTCIKTLMGEVEYSRAVYQVMDKGSPSVIKAYGMWFRSSALKSKQRKTDMLSSTKNTNCKEIERLPYCLRKQTEYL